MNLTELSRKIHENARDKGFYKIDDDIKKWNLNSTEAIKHALTAQKLALINSEVSEALEADREDNYADFEDFDSKIANYYQCSEGEKFKEIFNKTVKNTFEDELADIIIRVLDLCGSMSIDIQRHIDLKMKYNSIREYKHDKNY